MSCQEKTSSFFRTLVRRRTMYAKEEMLATPLHRCLNVSQLILYGVATMAGGGVYVLTGTMIGKSAGAAACISYLIAGIAATFTAMCYAEFAVLIPKAGSVYVYTYLMVGELPAFIIGWTTVADAIVGMSAIAKAFSGTIDLLTHNIVQNWTIEHFGRLTSNPHGALAVTPDLIGFALVLVITLITATGARSSLTMNSIVTVIQLVCLVITTVGCYVYGSTASWSSEHGGFAPNGFHGIIQGATIAIFAYAGFDSIANAAEETKDPKKTIPRAMLASVALIIALYVSASLGLALLVPREFINFKSPFVSGFQTLDIKWLIYIAATGTLLATGASKIAGMYLVPRVLYAIACDGLIFHLFAMVEKRTQMPLFSLFFGGTIVGLLALFFSIRTLSEFVSLGYLLSYFMIGVDIMIMRYIYDMPPGSIGASNSTAEPDDSKNELSETNLHSDFVPLRKRFARLGEKYPEIQTKRAFILLLCIFIGASFFASVTIDFVLKANSPVSILLTAFSLLILLMSGASLCLHEPTVNNDVYQTPLMPLMPLLTISINSLLVFRLSALTWLRFLIWTVIGLLIYFSYGRRHSVMAKSRSQHSEDSLTLIDGKKYGT